MSLKDAVQKSFCISEKELEYIKSLYSHRKRRDLTENELSELIHKIKILKVRYRSMHI